MIYDCFTFFNELDLLEIRCEELKSLNINHVLIECNKTHSGLDKPFYFNKNKERFSKYNIIHIMLDCQIETINPWVREIYQRNHILNVLMDIASPNDNIIISDVDEIPRASTIKDFCSDISYLRMDNFYYWLNCRTDKQEWTSAFIVKYKYLSESNLTPSEIRVKRKRDIFIPNAGWHFSWSGGINAIKTKLESFAHQEYNSKKYKTKERIERAMDIGTNFMNDNNSLFEFIPMDDSFPKYVINNISKFKHLIKWNTK